MRSALFLFLAGLGFFGQAAPAFSAMHVKMIMLSMQPRAAISPLIYGANYVWSTVPQSAFASWVAALQGTQAPPAAPVSLVRYPGGWDGEWYDWSGNTMLDGGPPYAAPGMAPAPLLSSLQPLTLAAPLTMAWRNAMAANGAMRAAVFQLPIREVVEASSTANIPDKVSQVVSQYLQILSLYHNAVDYWEIGNEWWLQRGAANDTAPLSSNPVLSGNLARYAELVAAAVPAMKAAYPGIRIYVSAYWATAGAAAADDEFVQLRAAVGSAAWSQIDGISIHPYCGTNVPQTLCLSIPSQVAKIQSETGKSDVFASEWAVVMDQSTDDYGIRNASATVSAFQDLALAGIHEATYWPAIGAVPRIALTDGRSLTPTGTILRAMSLLYEGVALSAPVVAVKGPPGHTVAVAAENKMMGSAGVAVIIPTNGDGLETIDLPLAGTGLTRVVASAVICSANPNTKAGAMIANLVALPFSIVPAANGSHAAQFILNPGTPGRGSNWEIALLELQ